MSTFKSFVSAMKGAESVSKKDEKFAALGNLDDVAKRCMNEMLSVFRVFGVKKFPMPVVTAESDASPDIFFALLDDLHDRKLTGNAAKSAITDTLALYTAETQKYLVRILGKDPKAGFSENTINKIYPNLIRTFTAMKGEKVTEKYKFRFPCNAEVKYDGERSVAFSGTQVLHFSYAGKLQEHLLELFAEEINEIEKRFGQPCIVDCEALGKNFQATMRAKKKGADRSELKLYVFDLMSQDEWEARDCPRTQQERRDQLAAIVAEIGSERIVLSESKPCENMEQLHAYYDEVVDRGFEGLMLKYPGGLYEWRRSKNWAKWKPILDLDLKIVGFYEGTPGTDNEGSLGGLVLEGYDENGTFVKTDCGTMKVRGGLLKDWLESIGVDFSTVTDVDRQARDEIWNNKEKYLGSIAMIECQELSKAEDGEHYSARFPVFVRFRDDKE